MRGTVTGTGRTDVIDAANNILLDSLYTTDEEFPALFEKYNSQILEYFKDEATEDFRERSQEEYGLDRWSAETDSAYDAWRDEKYFGESFSDTKPFLAESDEFTESKKLLADCPECGVSESFDHISGICANCGFSI